MKRFKRCFFVDHLCYLHLVFVMLSGLFIATPWERADLLALVCDVWLCFLSHSRVVSWVRCGT